MIDRYPHVRKMVKKGQSRKIKEECAQLTFTYSKSTIETLEKGVKCVHS